MVSRGAAQKEEARQIAPGCSSIRSGFWNTLCPPLHSLAKAPFGGFPLLIFVYSPNGRAFDRSVDCSWTLRPKALDFRFRRGSQWLRHRLLLQCVLEHFVKRVDVSDLDVADNLGCQVGHDVRFVVRG